MKCIFFATSAIHTNTGVVPIELRLQQSIETAVSIKQKIPDANVILLEGGLVPLSLYERYMLLQYYDDIIDYSYHPQILQLQKNCYVDGKTDAMYLKGPCETFMLYSALERINNQEKCRYFKISGRYGLSDNFNLQNHDVKGKYVFKTKEPGVVYYGGPVDENGKELTDWIFTEYQYKTRLYSFCGTIVDKVRDNYKRIFETILEIYSNSGFIDIEHASFRVIDSNLVHEIYPVGLIGVQAENGEVISE